MATLSSTTKALDELSLQSAYAVSSSSSGWHSSWGNITTRSSHDQDWNSYYMGVYAYADDETETDQWWWTRLSFTIPSTTVVAKSNTLTLTIEVPGTSQKSFYAIPTRGILTTYTKNSETDPDHYVGRTDHISTAWMKDASGTTITKQWMAGGALLYFTFTDLPRLTPGTTYYIYLVGYSSTSSAITNWNFNQSGFNGENLPSDYSTSASRAYTLLVYDYEPGSVWINLGTDRTANNWRRAIPYISNGDGTWHQAIPYMSNGTTWKISGG